MFVCRSGNNNNTYTLVRWRVWAGDPFVAVAALGVMGRTIRQCYQYLRSHCVVNATCNGPLAFLPIRSFSVALADAIV